MVEKDFSIEFKFPIEWKEFEEEIRNYVVEAMEIKVREEKQKTIGSIEADVQAKAEKDKIKINGVEWKTIREEAEAIAEAMETEEIK